MASGQGDEGDDAAVDGALAARVAAGDRAAEDALVGRLTPRVRAWALRRTGDPAAAADLAQHVVVVVLERLRAGEVDDPARIAPFVYTTCKHVLSRWRTGERRRGALLAAHGEALAPRAEPPPAGLDLRRLAGCLERLSARERTILVLTFWAEREADAIAAELESTAGAVRVARHRALRTLHACMEGSP